jgi:DNA-binding GntR family transcriptional regulator
MTDMTELSLFTLEDLIEARRWIEDMDARAVCERADKEIFDRLESNMLESERARRGGRLAHQGWTPTSNSTASSLREPETLS